MIKFMCANLEQTIKFNTLDPTWVTAPSLWLVLSDPHCIGNTAHL